MQTYNKKTNIGGFIQIPILILLLIGVTGASVGGYYAFRETNQEQQTEVVAKSSTEAELNTEETESAMEESKSSENVLVEENPLDLDDYKLDTNKTDPDKLADEVLQALNSKTEVDIAVENLDTLLSAISSTKESYITYAENAGKKRADLLLDLASLVSDSGLKNFIKDTASDFQDHSDNARSSYSELYAILENEIEIEKKLVLSGEEVKEGQYDRFLSLFQKANEAVNNLEGQKSNNYSQALSQIESLIGVSQITASVSQQLSEIEIEANKATVQKDIRCWATTEYSGGIVNGKAYTSIRCE